MLVRHVPAHGAHYGELLVADGTSSLTFVFLHVGAEAASLGVPLPTDLASRRTICGKEQGL